jgi:hypothetical protein
VSALPFDAATVTRLACPVCFGNLSFATEKLACDACGRVYPIVDGIPVLIAERAEAPEKSQAKGE